MKPLSDHERSGLLVVATSLVGATLLLGIATQLHALPPAATLSPPPVITSELGVLNAPAPPLFAPPALPSPGALAPAASEGAVAVVTRLDRTAVMEGGEGLVHVELTLEGAQREGADSVVSPMDVVVVLDRSSSMGGDKFVKSQSAVRGLIDTLGAQDRFALVTYSGAASLTIPMGLADSDQKAAWRGVVSSLGVGGSTNIAGALDLAHRTVEASRKDGRLARVILLSDGQPTAGDQSHDGLVGRARKALTREYVLSTVGVGADYNEALMVGLADAGTGNYYHLAQPDALARVFEGEFAAGRLTVAKNVKVFVPSVSGVELIDAGGYPITPGDGQAWFAPGSLFSGQKREIWLTYRVSTEATGKWTLGTLDVSWAQMDEPALGRSSSALGVVYCVDDQDVFMASINQEVWEKSIVQDGFAKLKLDVAQAVREGDKNAAQARLRQWEETNRAMNVQMQSEAVRDQLLSLGYLGAEVDEAFSGRDQAAKQKTLSKTYNAEGYDGRRMGSKIF